MSSLFSRRDVIVVASVSCIYGIGSREDYEAMIIPFAPGWNCRANNSSRGSWICFTTGMTSSSPAASSACAATRWNFVPPGAKTGCGWNFLARPSNA